jgi:hypothetical protein
MEKNSWEITSERFVAFFDILGFKDLVARNTHNNVLKKLEILKRAIQKIEGNSYVQRFEDFKVETDQTKVVTFSDSLIIFSKGAKDKDAVKIISDCYEILRISIKNGISIKGAISFGEITVDFEKSLFFGQPLIDAYLLHDELQMLTVIMDHNFEKRWEKINNEEFNEIIITYKVNLKCGRITHKILRPHGQNNLQLRINYVKYIYSIVSGRPRLYLDNTIEFLNSMLLTTN